MRDSERWPRTRRAGYFFVMSLLTIAIVIFFIYGAVALAAL
jgi:hypothetical protein